MLKYELLPQQLLHEGTCQPDNFFEPEIPNDKHIDAVHDPDYFYDLLNLKIPPREARKIGFPLNEVLVERERIIADGTLKGCHYALEYGMAMNIAGGTHHAYTNRGEAFCMLNDQAIGAQYLLDNELAGKILILDLDVHQGNGTAEIFREEPRVFTCSVHGAKNYPFMKEVSDWDTPLPAGTTDADYLGLLENLLPEVMHRAAPDFVFYLSGVDILESDKLGTLSMSLAGCRARDEKVLRFFKARGIPVQCSMGGGYSPDIRTIVEAHANTFRLAQQIYF